MRVAARGLCVLLLALAACGIAADGSSPTDGKQKATKKARRQARKQAALNETRTDSPDDLEHRLQMTRVPVRFDETPLEDALRRLAREVDADLMIDRKAIEDEGIDLSSPITLKLEKPLSVQDAVDLSMRTSGEALTICFRFGGLWLTTEIEAGSLLETKVYDCRDILGSNRERPTPEFQPGNVGGFTDESGGMFSEILESCIDPDTWSEVGGAGRVVIRDGLLIVRQTQAVHRQIRQLLHDYRETIAARKKAESVP